MIGKSLIVSGPDVCPEWFDALIAIVRLEKIISPENMATADIRSQRSS